MRSSRKWLFISVLFILTFALNACNDEGDSDSGEAKELIIGYSGPLSGPAAFYGEETLNGLTLAVEDINEAGGFEVDGQT
jgi:branched-chain amino acid transport system substrate-binding protein